MQSSVTKGIYMSVRLRSRRWDLVNYLSSQLKPLQNLFYTWQFAPSMIHWILTFGIAPCLHRIWTCCILQCKKSSLFKGLYLNVDVKNNPCQYPTEDMQSNNIFIIYSKPMFEQGSSVRQCVTKKNSDYTWKFCRSHRKK